LTEAKQLYLSQGERIMVNIKGSTVVVTGGQRGLGKAIVEEFLRRGAAKVYATARAPKPSEDPRVVSVELDVTKSDSVAALANTASDADIVVNNAGILGGLKLLDSDIEEVREVFETNYFGALRVARPSRRCSPKTAAGPSSTSVRCCLGWAASVATETPRLPSGH